MLPASHLRQRAGRSKLGPEANYEEVFVTHSELESGYLPWASFVLIRIMPNRVFSLPPSAERFSKTVPLGYVFIAKRESDGSLKARLPGGLCAAFEKDPSDTLLRVVMEDVGINVGHPGRVKLAKRFFGGKPEPHWRNIYLVDIDELQQRGISLVHRNSENYRPVTVSSEELHEWLVGGNLCETHRVWLELAGLLPRESFRAAM
jgi:hypothetical protein